MISQRTEINEGNIYNMFWTVAAWALAFYDGATGWVSNISTTAGWLVGVAKSTTGWFTVVAWIDSNAVYAFDPADITIGGWVEAWITAKKIVFVFLNLINSTVTTVFDPMVTWSPVGRIVWKEDTKYLVKFNKDMSKVI